MRKMDVLKPSFYDKFQCIGGTCRQNCCSNWNIELTKEEFKNTKRHIHSPEMKEIFANAFHMRNVLTGKKTDTYFMKLKEDGSCPFLDEQGLCRIYIECGPEVMTRVCKVFPRRFTTFENKRVNFCLSLGCEEVVRLLLAEKDGFILESSFEPVDMLPVNHTLKPAAVEIHKYFYDIQTLLFAILQNREYTLGQRMVLLGMTLQKIDTMAREKKSQQIPEYVLNFLQQMDMPEARKIYEDFFESKQTDGTLRANNTLLDFCNHCVKTREIPDIIQSIFARYHVTYKNRVENIFPSEQKNSLVMEFDAEEYRQAEKYFTTYLEENPHFLENIIVAAAWYSDYPYIANSSIWEAYCIFAVVYSIYRFILASYITPTTTEEQIIDCIVGLSRALLHQDGIQRIAEELENNNSATLAHMAMLVL